MIIPQINANKRKCLFGGFNDHRIVYHPAYDKPVEFANNNINYSRSFAFICGK